ncbi:CCR4-NOT transcription complex subunit 6-like [Trichonephila inaurata madagascariensis]|uniref:CCR4-NOT transcription complex subunit 6-like n=1 Tax=Trichonephila inaurata madagascariensis TaxID=2747483 RepID=A0A8X7CLF8_9ARAC|nr:CCR4-NOT transcription complex subunit 6-like [Trichonephila inaurata madagascariensis]
MARTKKKKLEVLNAEICVRKEDNQRIKLRAVLDSASNICLFTERMIFRFWGLDEADLMSKRYPKKKERNHYVHPNPRRLYCIMPVDEASKRPKEEYTELEITGNVRRLSSSLWQMTSLTSLYLNNNALTSIPSEISLLVNLAHLNLSFNQLRNIPPEMGDMTSLRELLLNNNNISTLPTQLGKLFKLCKLELTGNPLGGHIMDIIRSPTCRTEDILSYLIDHLPDCLDDQEGQYYLL